MASTIPSLTPTTATQGYPQAVAATDSLISSQPSFGSVLAQAKIQSTASQPSTLPLNSNSASNTPSATSPTTLASQLLFQLSSPANTGTTNGAATTTVPGTASAATALSQSTSLIPNPTKSRAEQFRERRAAAPQTLPNPLAPTDTGTTVTAAATPPQAVAATTVNAATLAAINQPNALAAAQNPLPSTGLPAGRSVIVTPQAPTIVEQLPASATPFATPEPSTTPISATPRIAPVPEHDVNIGLQSNPLTQNLPTWNLAGTAPVNSGANAQTGGFASVLTGMSATEAFTNSASLIPTTPVTATAISSASLLPSAPAPVTATSNSSSIIPTAPAPVTATSNSASVIPTATASVVGASNANSLIPGATVPITTTAEATNQLTQAELSNTSTTQVVNDSAVGNSTNSLPSASSRTIPVGLPQVDTTTSPQSNTSTLVAPSSSTTVIAPSPVVVDASIKSQVVARPGTSSVNSQPQPISLLSGGIAETSDNFPASSSISNYAQIAIAISTATANSTNLPLGTGVSSSTPQFGVVSTVRQRYLGELGGIGNSTTTLGSNSTLGNASIPALSEPGSAAAQNIAQTTSTRSVASPAVQMADEIANHSQSLSATGSSDFRFSLDPPELGKVQVHLISDTDGIRGHVVVASDSVRQTIENQLPELRQRLEAAGVSVGQLDVSTNTNSGGGQNAQPGETTPTVAFDSPAATKPLKAATRAPVGTLDVTV